jgi:hypothetical protein
MALVSHQSLATSAPVWDTCLSACVAPTVTADGRVRVIITKTKPKLHLPKTQRPVVRLGLNDNDDDYYDETTEFQVGYRRPELINQTANVHDNMSDEIKIRLVLARKRALEAHARKWA